MSVPLLVCHRPLQRKCREQRAASCARSRSVRAILPGSFSCSCQSSPDLMRQEDLFPSSLPPGAPSGLRDEPRFLAPAEERALLEARWLWQHSVPPLKALRYSITLHTAPRLVPRDHRIDADEEERGARDEEEERAEARGQRDGARRPPARGRGGGDAVEDEERQRITDDPPAEDPGQVLVHEAIGEEHDHRPRCR